VKTLTRSAAMATHAMAVSNTNVTAENITAFFMPTGLYLSFSPSAICIYKHIE
jgi:hypothetical protein